MEEIRRTVDRSSGFCSETKIFHSIGPSVTLPPLTEPLSVTDYAFSLLSLSSPAATTPYLIDSASSHVITYPDFIARTKSLSTSLQVSFPSLSRNDVALVLSSPSLHVPVLYFSLLTLGVTVCPINPLATPSELAHMMKVANPVIAFTISSLSSKIPALKLPTILIDSPKFKLMASLLADRTRHGPVVEQSDRAAILFSSGTTGLVKGVDITHRNLIASLAKFHYEGKRYDASLEEGTRARHLFPLPMFHVFGFMVLLGTVTLGETLVMMTEARRGGLEGMLEAVERFKVNTLPAVPPVVMALGKSPFVARYDLRTLKVVKCGGAPLGKETIKVFLSRFPGIEIIQGYGLTEAGSVTTMSEPNETIRYTSVGRLAENLEAKIVNHISGEALPPNQRGELWIRGPTIMRGYVGDEEATAAILDGDGWLKTGDLCYFDSDGFLYVVERLKELIKYKAYQVPPAELENLLQEHPEIADAAVVPYPDEEAGQIPMAFVVRKPNSNITAKQVMEYIAKQVSPYKKIRRVEFIDAIPKSPAGKILRRELVTHAVSGASSKL